MVTKTKGNRAQWLRRHTLEIWHWVQILTLPLVNWIILEIYLNSLSLTYIIYKTKSIIYFVYWFLGLNVVTCKGINTVLKNASYCHQND